MPSYAPLPGWTIDGVKFSRRRHLGRVLAVLGCHIGCPVAYNDVLYLKNAISNERGHDGVQKEVPGMCIVSAKADFWVEQDGGRHRYHGPVDGDLVYPYVRVHPFPFTFSRPILVRSPSSDSIVQLFVADIHLRWSEIARGIQDPLFYPPRYTAIGYPFNRDYFDLARALFKPRFVFIPEIPHGRRAQIVHAASELVVSHAGYTTNLERLVAFDAAHSEDVSVFVLWTVDCLVREVEAEYRTWWIHREHAVRAYRHAVLDSALSTSVSLDEMPDKDRFTYL
ncbi:hypothetical protein L226DRAFT_570000 [Lentinus tigrinus ALCF2SS1-7]|uniref:Uncharacterized protein n=1 Tax=Lentinus tigrinus ALCF2SS1-6 TaxID=1328759 RepID=A0A5C2SGP8_9APHY|nr:hypothetical protein L227DRAFT_611047 [Lentinus tigrinus ALCF2SS1-6]RPD75749.1 hypothetical protein L226DRAFT_570000 [Lentinus tigrinus ALCF2SS1-7]